MARQETKGPSQNMVANEREGRMGLTMPQRILLFHSGKKYSTVCWCNPSYLAQLKDIEDRLFPLPIQAIVADSKLQHYTITTDNAGVPQSMERHC